MRKPRFFLWNAAPDDTMIKAAESGDIQSPKGREKIVNMMLASPRLETGMRAFFDDMMAFDDFNNLAKDAAIYPAFTGVTVADAREQTLRTITLSPTFSEVLPPSAGETAPAEKTASVQQNVAATAN